MSLITSASITPQVPPPAAKAVFLKQLPQAMFAALFAQWKNGVEMIWNDANPQAVLDAIGTDAAELFAKSSQNANFLESVLAGCTTTTIALVKPFTINADGSITINPS